MIFEWQREGRRRQQQLCGVRAAQCSGAAAAAAAGAQVSCNNSYDAPLPLLIYTIYDVFYNITVMPLLPKDRKGSW